MANLVGKIGKKGHISGTIGLIWLKIKMHKYFQVTSPPQGMRLCSKIKDTQDFIYLKYLEKFLQRYRAGSIRRCGCIAWGAHTVLHALSLIHIAWLCFIGSSNLLNVHDGWLGC